MPSWRSSALAVAAVAVLGVFTPGVAHAAPPSNDDFESSTAIAALPFTVEQNTTEATKAVDDPSWCQSYNVKASVWFHYTATEDAILRATSAGSDRDMIIAAHTGSRGDLSGVDHSCTTGRRYPATFRVTAGTTYYFMISGYDSPGGALKFSLDKMDPAPNDAFAAAGPVGLPFTAQPDMSVASFEADEPDSTCVYDEKQASIWYSYTPSADQSLVPRAQGGNNSNDADITVYTGSDIASLTEVMCADGSYYPTKVFRAKAGTTYYFRFTAPYVNYQPVTVGLAEAPPLQPVLGYNGNGFNVYSDVSFYPDSYSDLDNPLTSEFDFGDGTTAPPAQTSQVNHRYAKDGTYRVTMKATTPDGRTGTTSTEIKIETHDVGITKFTVPTSARAGQSKPITVNVSNTRYLEKATVKLFRSNGSSWDEVGSTTLEIPAHRTRTVAVPFSYTFTPADAAMGKVTFRTEVSLAYPIRDARELDNEVIAIATTVRPAATTAAVAN
jgi:hypothetical protein